MEYGDVTNKSSPAYWKSRGYIIIELEDSTYEECDYVLFVYQNKSCIFSAGDTARRELGEAYLKLQKASKQLYNDILFVSKKV